jgi:hypothetical protein
MCMQVALFRPGYTYGHEWFSRKRTGPWAGPGAGREHAIAPLVTLLRANRTHMLAVLHHLPDAWTRYVRFARAAEHEAQTLTVGQMIWRQATHALEHIDEIHLTRRCARPHGAGALERWPYSAGRRAEPTASVHAGSGPYS